MMMQNDTGARKLEQVYPELDLINYSDVHRHDPKKVIAFSAPRAAETVRPGQRRREAARAAREYRLLVSLPQGLCIALLALFFYLRLAVFPAEAPAALTALWCGAYLLAGFGFWNRHMLRRNARRQ